MRPSFLLSALMGSFLLSVLLGGAFFATPEISVAAPDATHAPVTEKLPEAARQVLRPWMQAHRTDMEQLLSATLFLKHRDIEETATALANDVHIARPAEKNGETLNSAIPSSFFVLQDQFRSAALRLAADARQKNDGALAKDFGSLMQTCVSCHSTFLPRE